jgi:gamma-glutamyltranspeptidase/glutathione hydrolase
MADGYPIEAQLANALERERKRLAGWPYSKAVFLPHAGEAREAPVAGEVFVQKDLAATLRKLVEAERLAKAKGASRSAAIKAAFDRFYRGDVAQEFERFFKENGGLLTAADLVAYEPQWTEPLHVSYRGYDVYSNPSSSRGGFEVLMQANLVEGFDLKSFGPGSPKALHAMIAPSSTRPATRSSIPSATPSASRRRSAASSATTSWWGRPASCSTTACAWAPPRRIPTARTTSAPARFPS